jgi:hypothetical protein
VYPIVTRQRAGAVGSSDLRFDDPASVRALISDRGLAVAAAMPEALMRNRQELLRFPILYDFHPRSEAESSYALLRGAAMICAVLRWDLGSERTTAAGLYANGIRATLDRTIGEYVSGYVHGLASDPHPAQQGDLRLALVGVKPDAEVTETELREFSAWAPHVETFLHRLAVEHRYTPRPLFAPLRPR